MIWIELNAKIEPFGDQRVRQALLKEAGLPSGFRTSLHLSGSPKQPAGNLLRGPPLGEAVDNEGS